MIPVTKPFLPAEKEFKGYVKNYLGAAMAN